MIPQPIRRIIRWSLGPSGMSGIKVLHQSIKHARKLFPEFEFFVFVNQLDEYSISHLKDNGARILRSADYLSCLPVKPAEGYNVHWKLYPPRIDLNSYEIFIDNDIVLFKRPQEIDLFLENHQVLMYQGINRALGAFDSLVPKGLRINSGIFGLPPGYDFGKELTLRLKTLSQWTDKYDEQGLVAATLSSFPNRYIIPLTSVPILEFEWNIKDFTTPLTCGYHFVGVNWGKKHNAWNEFNGNKLIV